MAMLLGVLPVIVAVALISRIPQLKQLVFNSRPVVRPGFLGPPVTRVIRTTFTAPPRLNQSQMDDIIRQGATFGRYPGNWPKIAQLTGLSVIQVINRWNQVVKPPGAPVVPGP